MSPIVKDVQVNLVLPSIAVSSHEKTLEVLTKEAGKDLMFDPGKIFTHIMDKEKIASSGIGSGVAIPHAKIPGLAHTHAVLATLARPINFGALDDMPVDVVFLLLSPEEDGPLHLRRLSRVSRVLTNNQLLGKIRSTNDAEAIRSLLTTPDGWMLAA